MFIFREEEYHWKDNSRDCQGPIWIRIWVQIRERRGQYRYANLIPNVLSSFMSHPNYHCLGLLFQSPVYCTQCLPSVSRANSMLVSVSVGMSVSISLQWYHQFSFRSFPSLRSHIFPISLICLFLSHWMNASDVRHADAVSLLYHPSSLLSSPLSSALSFPSIFLVSNFLISYLCHPLLLTSCYFINLPPPSLPSPPGPPLMSPSRLPSCHPSAISPPPTSPSFQWRKQMESSHMGKHRAPNHFSSVSRWDEPFPKTVDIKFALRQQ